jgi:hypothetical protein
MYRGSAPRLLFALCLAVATASPAQEEAPAPRHEDAALVPLPWALPPADSCRPEGGLHGWPPGRDAPPVPFESGDTFGVEKIGVLEDFLPPFIWEYRDRFFYEGMRLEIGRCFADYGPPGFYRSATASHAGQARITEDGGIADYSAGLPFPPDRIPPDDPDLGTKWAWNFELRYQGAGFWGKFRTSDMVGRDGRAEPFVGEIFKVQTAFRSDRDGTGYEPRGAKQKHWVAGGLLFEPFDARHYAWRQYRHRDHLTKPDRSDDLHAYLPDFRRVRRVPSAGIEGIYMPSFSVGVVKPTSVAGVGSDSSGGGAAGGSAAAASSITT